MTFTHGVTEANSPGVTFVVTLRSNFRHYLYICGHMRIPIDAGNRLQPDKLRLYWKYSFIFRLEKGEYRY